MPSVIGQFPLGAIDRESEEITVARGTAEARRLGQTATGSDHLVIALTATDSVAGNILRAMGMTIDPAHCVLHQEMMPTTTSVGGGP